MFVLYCLYFYWFVCLFLCLNVVVVGGWRKVAYETFKNAKGDLRKYDATYDMLNREYPDSQWSLFVFLQVRTLGRNKDLYSVTSNGGREAEKRGWEEEEETWIIIPSKDRPGREFLYTLYIWRALRSHYGNKLRKATTEEKKKVNQIINSLIEKEKRELQLYSNEEKSKMEWSKERWRDELIQQMDNTQLLLNKWKHIIVTRSGHCQFNNGFAAYHSEFSAWNMSNKIYICFTDSYSFSK